MKLKLDCIPCFQRQAIKALSTIGVQEEEKEKILREVMKTLQGLDWASTPPEMAHRVHKIIRDRTGEDPYRDLKREHNKFVMDFYPKWKKMISQSSDPLETAVKLAIAGNIIDYGANDDFDMDATINKVMKTNLGNGYKRLRKKLETTESLLYFFDNAGEIVFDKLLIGELLRKDKFREINFVVKGGPIINDATIEDAKAIGLDKIPKAEFLYVSNGTQGTGPERSSEEVQEWIRNHDLVISKGQGNYEDMSEFQNLFFMLLVKCPTIASDIDAEVGQVILKYNEK